MVGCFIRILEEVESDDDAYSVSEPFSGHGRSGQSVL